MRMYDLIRQKRDGGVLSDEEIRAIIEGYVAGKIPDYQISALLMAIYFRGMTAAETLALTLAIRDSGEKLNGFLSGEFRVDKHSTGGVGDKTSLVVAPVVAALGVKVAKMSGRGLGHTGGTVDKLESIPGFRTDLSTAAFKAVVDKTGLAIVGQSRSLAPADKLLYALRDVTATVDSIPLIASSIMGKKLAADDDAIVLDVKTGSGAFMKSVEQSEELARVMVEIGKGAGKKTIALVTDMDKPLGNTIGNALEVMEAIETLRGEGPADLYELCVELAADMLYLAEKGSREECRNAVVGVLKNGKALDTFAAMVEAQGGDCAWIEHPARFPKAPCESVVKLPCDGYIEAVDAEEYGRAALLLGAGRNTMEDSIDMAAGIRLLRKTGDPVQAGDALAILYTSDFSRLSAAEACLLQATRIGRNQPQARPLILSRIE